MERSTGEHGKGFFWSVDPEHERTFEEQEARAAAQAQSQSASSSALQTGGKDGNSKNSRRKDKGVPLDPPLKRSVKSGVGPLPPPLTSTPLKSVPDRKIQAPLPGPLFTTVPRPAMTGNSGVTVQETKSEPTDSSQISSTSVAGGLPTLSLVASSGSSPGLVSSAGTPTHTSTPRLASSSTDAPSATSSVSTSPFAALPPSVCLPIVIGPVPSSHPASSTSDPPPIVLHNHTLILSPVIFSSLAPEQLKALEEMGAQKALEVLQAHIVRYLKERMGKKKRKKGIAGATEKGGTKTDRVNTLERSSPFTTVPLPSRTAQSTPASQVPTTPFQGSMTSHPPAQMPNTETTFSNVSDFCKPMVECPAIGVQEGIPSTVDSSPPVPVPISDDSRSQTPTIVVVDEDAVGRATKRRKLEHEVEIGTLLKHEESAAPVSQDVDEDIEVDVC